jgi:WD40 repeat protein
VIVDTASWQPTASWVAHDGDAMGIAFDPAKPLVATTGKDRKLRVWTLDGKQVAEATLAAPGNAVAFSDDGKQLFAATDASVAVFAVGE